jgi:predicted PurR-regulated permease PerM
MALENDQTEKRQIKQYPDKPEEDNTGRKVVIGLVVGGLVILAVIAVAVYFLVQPTTDTARIRDIFIIFMALISLLLGVVLIILIIQLARLINLLQNEVKPILDSTNETVNTLRGTTAFLSDHLVEPVMKMNEYLAAISQFAAIIGLSKSRRKNRDL